MPITVLCATAAQTKSREGHKRMQKKLWMILLVASSLVPTRLVFRRSHSGKPNTHGTAKYIPAGGKVRQGTVVYTASAEQPDKLRESPPES